MAHDLFTSRTSNSIPRNHATQTGSTTSVRQQKGREAKDTQNMKRATGTRPQETTQEEAINCRRINRHPGRRAACRRAPQQGPPPAKRRGTCTQGAHTEDTSATPRDQALLLRCKSRGATAGVGRMEREPAQARGPAANGAARRNRAAATREGTSE